MLVFSHWKIHQRSPDCGLSFMRFHWHLSVLLIVSPVLAQAQSTTDAEGLKFFEQKIRPVLVQHCYACHSEAARDNKKLKAGLFLDSAEGMLTGGDSGAALVKGKSAGSLLIEALKYDGLEMPPSGKLSDEVIADFVKWIDSGAPDPRQGKTPVAVKREINIEEGKQWWSFQPLKQVTPPDIADDSRGTSPIDRFVFAKQLEHGLTPNGAATKEKLIRRAYFDLIGLPPTPEQVQAFLSDNSPRAFEQVIDGLLDSPHYGERWARHWLDVARYAESGGYEFDGFRPGAYHYRDWVIRAFNSDLPYDRFLQMQLAGDKLQPDDYHGAAAAGFLVAGPYPGQITAKTVERIRYDQLDDMLMTIGGSMLGLTLGCARCHDHKYDPLPTQDYYALAASLAQSVHGSKAYDPDPAVTQLLAEKHRREREPLDAALRKFAHEELPKLFDAWRKSELPQQPEASRWQVFSPVDVEAERSWLKMLPSGVIAHDGAIAAGSSVPQRGRRRAAASAEEFRITVHTSQKNVTALRLDAFTEKSLPQRGPGLNADGSFQLGELKVTARPLDAQSKEAPLELKLKPVFAAFEDKDQPLQNAVDGKPATAWVVKTTAKKDNAAVFEIEGGLPGFAGGTELRFELKFRDLGIGRLRLALSTEPNPATWAGDVVPQHLGEIRTLLAAHKNQLPETLREPMARWFSPFDAETARVWNAVRDHAQREPRPPFTEVYTTIAGGQDVFLLKRGEVDEKQGKSEPGFLQVLLRSDRAETVTASVSSSPASTALPPVTEPRVALANWITDVDRGAGSLAARVMVNRVWQHHFGEGLVTTPNDFGAQGDRPTHPELLEWLAGELVRGGWKLKPLHKQIMLSAVYQQSHAVSAKNQKLDPENRYLWHHRPRRLDAESIRDALLAVGGTLDPQMFGPSLMDNSLRRSIYLRVKRSELIPLMTMFDAPEPTQSIGERISTTVPTQALTLMNSPFVRQQAEKLAQRIRLSKETPLPALVDRAYEIAFSRQPTDSERNRMLAFVDRQRTVVEGDEKANIDQALTEFCQVLLCLNEFIYID